ncbi:ribonuclease P/MRP protein subunit POP1, partial [Phenoliferia sp. Uapishka_3]
MPPKRPGDSPATGADKKRARMREQRVINVQPHASRQGGSASRGNANLPPTLEVEKFAEARVFEINSLQQAMRSAKAAGTIRAFQSLPRALRRRAASHNIRRLPIRLRAKAKTETPDGAAAPKKKSRKMMGMKLRTRAKYSRKELLLRRQVKKCWLETHIWHAKRMHMKNIWGHRLVRPSPVSFSKLKIMTDGAFFQQAEKPTEKAYRSSYRASVNGALVHDASYYQYIEIKGPEASLKRLFDAHFDPQATSPCSKRYSTGARECQTHIYTSSSQPNSLIGPATVIWDSLATPFPKPPPSHFQPYNRRQVLIRLHPSICIAAWNALSDTLKADGKTSVGIRQLEKEFLTFEVTGRRATEVVKAVLKLTPGNGSEVKEAWKKLSSAAGPGSVPLNMIFGLDVYDPRLSFPPKLDKSSPKTTSTDLLQPSYKIAQLSSFWDKSVRDRLKSPQFKKSELDARRSKLLIPGSRLTALQQDDRIPILLSQRTLSPSSTTSTPSDLHGWTLTIPSGWGIPFWSSLIFSETRPGGLLARSQQSFEAGAPRFPEDYPGTVAFDLYEAEREVEDKGYWERRPPAKRPNYEKLGTRMPWKSGFGKICRTSSPEYLTPKDGGEVWIVSGKVVMEVQEALKAAEGEREEAKMSEGGRELLKQRLGSAKAKEKQMKTGEQIKGDRWVYGTALVRVRITPCGRGAPEELACLYWLSEEQAKQVGEKVERGRKRTPVATGEGENGDELCEPLPTPKSLIGRVTTGNFSLAVGRGAAVGAVPLVVYLDLMERNMRYATLPLRIDPSYLSVLMNLEKRTKPTTPMLVAVRNRDGETFRAATLELMH